MNRNQIALISLLAMTLLGGCGPKKGPNRASTQPNPTSPTMDDVTQRMSELQKSASELAGVVQKLPGTNADNDRALTAEAFDHASASLTLLGGPQPGGALRQQLRIMDEMRQRLRGGQAGMSYDPAVDTGLRSLQNGLVYVRERLFPNDANIGKGIDAMRDRTGELDAVRGPLHTIASAHAFAAASDVITQMSNQLSGRNAATEPATQP